MDKKLFFVVVLLLLSMTGRIQAQCNPDITPPVIAVNSSLVLYLSNNQVGVVTAAQMVAGSNDNCTPANQLQYFIELAPASATPPSTTEVTFSGSNPGSKIVVVWAVDAAGNANYAWAEVIVGFCVTSSLACNNDVTVSLDANNTAVVDPFDILEGGPYCPSNAYLLALDGVVQGPVINLDAGDIGSHLVAVSSVAGGVVLGTCWGTLQVITSCTNDTLPPVGVAEASIEVSIDPAISPIATITTAQINEGSYDNCTAPSMLLLELQRVDSLGAPIGPYGPTVTFTAADAGTQLVKLRITDLAGNENFVITAVEVTVVAPIVRILQGKVFLDGNADCVLQSSGESGLEGWVVAAKAVATGETYIAISQPDGTYAMMLSPTETVYEVNLQAAYNYHPTCGTDYTVAFNNVDTMYVDIPVQLDTLCPRLLVDIATPKIRPCFAGTYYVHYTNASAQTVAGTYIQVALDDYLAYQGSTIPATALGNQVYEFATGTLSAGASGFFSINFTTDCNAPFGATHCTEAHIFPDTLCPESEFWSGANVAVEGYCENDTVYLKIKNTGFGDTESLEYIVVEDVLMREGGEFMLPAGGELNLTPIPSDGSTFRLEAQQEPGHPYGGTPWVAIEGCAGFTPGMVTLFPTSSANPFIATYCRQNTASYDPNAKEGLPMGYGGEHLIAANTKLEYLIQFQNLGTDTAFKIIVLDTLSPFLNPATLRPGASSHPYNFSILDGRIARFSFDPIALPHQSVNDEGSQGFVHFTIDQMPDNPDGTKILNNAAIYFDFNPAIITNETQHTVGKEFIAVSNVHESNGYPHLAVFPNPTTDILQFNAPNYNGDPVSFRLRNSQGQIVKSLDRQNLPMEVKCAGLPSGVYYFELLQRGVLGWSGQIVIQQR